MRAARAVVAAGLLHAAILAAARGRARNGAHAARLDALTARAAVRDEDSDDQTSLLQADASQNDPNAEVEEEETKAEDAQLIEEAKNVEERMI